jgi:hypothetical protein
MEIGELTSGAMYMRDPVVPVRLYSCSPLAMLPLPFRLGNRPADNAASACQVQLHNGMHAMHGRGNNGSDAPSSTDMFGLIANFKMMAYFINEPSEL